MHFLPKYTFILAHICVSSSCSSPRRRHFVCLGLRMTKCLHTHVGGLGDFDGLSGLGGMGDFGGLHCLVVKIYIHINI